MMTSKGGLGLGSPNPRQLKATNLDFSLNCLNILTEIKCKYKEVIFSISALIKQKVGLPSGTKTENVSGFKKRVIVCECSLGLCCVRADG